jgi:hypothetical protein
MVVLLNKEGRWEFKCPHCSRNRTYNRKDVAITHFNKKDRCRKCCCEGSRNYMFDKSPSLETRNKMSLKAKGQIPSIEERKKLSNSMKKVCSNPIVREQLKQRAIKQERWKNHIAVDKGQLEFLKKWNKLGFNFEPNYPLKTKDFLAYLDGYDITHNIVLEYDSKYHNSTSQKQKDLIRQLKIIDILKPKKFWRYNAKNKTIENVLTKE